MAKADLGTKRTCPNCGAKFYDLGRQPALCPKCSTEFDPETLAGAIPAAKDLPPEESEAKPAEAAEEADGFEDEKDDMPEVDEAAAQIPDSDDDDDEEGSGLSDDIGDDFEEDDLESDDEDDNTTVLIDEEEDEDFGDFNIDKEEDL